MKRVVGIITLAILGALAGVSAGFAFTLFGGAKTLTPTNGIVSIPLKEVDDGKAHFFEVLAVDGIKVRFFVLKSKDGVVRAAIDACDVCYQAGKGYEQDGDFMVCRNCGQKFASSRINEVKGGCNPAPLNRKVNGDRLEIEMKDINANSWYCKFFGK